MKLRRPTDFLILHALEMNGRNVATNLAELTGKSRNNINTRLPVLDDYDLVQKIGPAERSGLYEITDKGERALVYADRYDDVDDFERLLQQPTAKERSEAPDTIVRRSENMLMTDDN